MQVFILKGFKSFAPELRIPKELETRILHLRILKGLAVRRELIRSVSRDFMAHVSTRVTTSQGKCGPVMSRTSGTCGKVRRATRIKKVKIPTRKPGARGTRPEDRRTSADFAFSLVRFLDLEIH